MQLFQKLKGSDYKGNPDVRITNRFRNCQMQNLGLMMDKINLSIF